MAWIIRDVDMHVATTLDLVQGLANIVGGQRVVAHQSFLAILQLLCE
eukprot:CAMPEP_0169093578 /NCGR_PEP_ID=MMETSP1015-20121227/17510_1 /TAXON_ID=342587 /ORGANISM="Karlodinium micrum, Strain CCMP2283" /LENGTH=46 /DNA_ID= /DNA_START= /DNA_END= /DNA_ORIENTATION=